MLEDVMRLPRRNRALMVGAVLLVGNVLAIQPLVRFADPVALCCFGVALASGMATGLYALTSDRRQRRLRRVSAAVVAIALLGLVATFVSAMLQETTVRRRCVQMNELLARETHSNPATAAQYLADCQR